MVINPQRTNIIFVDVEKAGTLDTFLLFFVTYIYKPIQYQYTIHFISFYLLKFKIHSHFLFIDYLLTKKAKKLDVFMILFILINHLIEEFQRYEKIL